MPQMSVVDEMGLTRSDGDLTEGGLQGDPGKNISALGWSGTVDTLAGRGPWPLRLASPATLSFARRKAHLGEAHLSVAEGAVDIADFTWDEGRITSRGRLAAVPVATLARLAGRPLPMRSTLTLGGNWALAAYQLRHLVQLLRRGALTRPKHAANLTTYEQASIGPLLAAARARDFPSFERAYRQATEEANRLHRELGHPDIVWRLPERDHGTQSPRKIKAVALPERFETGSDQKSGAPVGTSAASAAASDCLPLAVKTICSACGVKSLRAR